MSIQPKSMERSAIRLNAKSWGKKFVARLLKPGVASYEDKGCGVVLLSKETIDNCISTFVGRPLVIRHMPTSPENMKSVGHGYICNVKYNDKDGWWYGEGICDTDEAAKEISRCGFGSVGYRVTNTAKGGEEHCVKYDEEITAFTGEHLAIVPNPRYEKATIILNSKAAISKNPMNVLKLFKKLLPSVSPVAAVVETPEQVEPAPAVVENAKIVGDDAGEEISADSEVVIGDAKVTLGRLVEIHNAAEVMGEGCAVGEKMGEDMGDAIVTADKKVMHNGKEIVISDLIAAFDKLAAKEAAEEVARIENAKVAAEVAAKAEADKAVKENGKQHFEEVVNAAFNAAACASSGTKNFETREDQLARGQLLFGTKAK